MPTVRVRRTPSDLCFLEWVSFYGGWCGLRGSGFCRMGLHGRFTIVGFQMCPLRCPPVTVFSCLSARQARKRLHSEACPQDNRWFGCEMSVECPPSGLPSLWNRTVN